MIRASYRYFIRRLLARLRRGRHIQSAANLSPSLRIKNEIRNAVPSQRIRNTQTLDEWQVSGRLALTTLLGLNQLPQRKLTKVVSKWSKYLDLGEVKKHYLIYDDNSQIPIYLASPHNLDEVKGTIICLQGHTSGMHVSIGLDSSENYPFDTGVKSLDIAQQALSNGYRAICVEQEGLGERREHQLKRVAPHPCHDAAMHRLLLGQTLMAVRIDDVLQVIQYLEESEQIARPLGVMGNSLGGSVSMFVACLTESVHFAVLSCCISQQRESLFSTYHCSDLYIPRLTLHFDTSDILGLIARKPLILATGVNDPIFPLGGFRQAYSAAKKLYRIAGAESQISAVIGHGGHQFYGSLIFPELRRILGN